MADRIENYVFAVSRNIAVTLNKWAVNLNRISKLVRSIIAIVFSQWLAWTPDEFSAGGTMTFTKTSETGGKYLKIGDTVIYFFEVIGTTGGAANTDIYCNLPFLPNEGFRLTSGIGLAVINDGNFVSGVTVLSPSRTGIVIRKYNNANYALATGVVLRCFGIYQCANLPENNRE